MTLILTVDIEFGKMVVTGKPEPVKKGAANVMVMGWEVAPSVARGKITGDTAPLPGLMHGPPLQRAVLPGSINQSPKISASFKSGSPGDRSLNMQFNLHPESNPFREIGKVLHV